MAHAPVGEDENTFLIFGGLPVSPPEPGLAPELAAFLGRWEGLSDGARDPGAYAAVLVVQEIGPRGGVAYLWAGEDFQYPYFAKKIRFRVVPGRIPAIEWVGSLSGAPGGASMQGVFRFIYDRSKDALVGRLETRPASPAPITLELGRGRSAVYYPDFDRFLASKRITFHPYQDPELAQFGRGYMVYLPEGYEDQPDKRWPLLVFLIGTGERGDSTYRFVKHGPLRQVREGKLLPFIIASPMLYVSPKFRSYPEEYLDGVMEPVLNGYRVDPSQVYLTGISMGGEATYRYALHQPELFAAIAPLAAFDARYLPRSVQEGFHPFEQPMERIRNIPVWAIHGSEDPVVPLSAAKRTADALVKAGGDVRFTVLDGYSHDVWTDTYADPGFYEWLLAHTTPGD